MECSNNIYLKLKNNSLENEATNDNSELSLNKDHSLIHLSQLENDLYESIIFSKNNILTSFNSQSSTKVLQKNLIGISKENINHIINELSGQFRNVIKNKNGNYFFSCLIKICDKYQRIKIIKELSNTLYEDCNDEFATHPIQNLIEIASNEEEFKIILSSFDDCNKIIMATLNKYGTYVIQKIIIHIPEEYRMNFNLIFVKFICVFSRDSLGIYAVKKFIAHTKNKIIVLQFLNFVLNNFVNIAQNKYGNYLIQYLLEIWWTKKEGEYIKNAINSKYNLLVKNNYSSYICNLYLKLLNQYANNNDLNN